MFHEQNPDSLDQEISKNHFIHPFSQYDVLGTTYINQPSGSLPPNQPKTQNNMNKQVYQNMILHPSKEIQANYGQILQTQLAQKQNIDLERKYQEKLEELKMLQNQQNNDWFGKQGAGAPLRDLQGNIITGRKHPITNMNSRSYDLGKAGQNFEKLSVEEINKIRRQEMEKAFQNENLKQMEEKAKRKDFEKKLGTIEQEIEDKKILKERQFLEGRAIEDSNKKDIESRNLQESNFLLMKKKLDNLKAQGQKAEKIQEKTAITTSPNTERIDKLVKKEEISEEVFQNMQNLFLKEIHLLKNELFYRQNVVTDQILGIKGDIMNANEMRKQAEDEIARLKVEIARTQYVDEIRQRELYKAMILRNNRPEFFHTLSERVRDLEVVPSFEFPKTKNYEDYFSNENANEEMEDILTNNAFFIKGNSQKSLQKPLKNKGNEGITLDEVEVFRANQYRLEALETGNPRDELEKLDKELFSFFKKREEEERTEDDESYHRLVDPLLERIRYPERSVAITWLKTKT